MKLFIYPLNKGRLLNKHWTLYFFFVISLLVCPQRSKAQKTYEWEIDRVEKREQEQKRISDSLMNYFKNRWEIKLSFGARTLNNTSRSTAEEPFYFPKVMSMWKLGGSWHVGERLALDLSIGWHLGKDVESPDVSSVLNGEDFELEGSAGIFIPIELGGIYYLLVKRYRPYIGMSLGSVLVRTQYTQAEGNASTGIDRTEFSSRDRVGLGTFRTGIDYRLNKFMQANVQYAYYVSGRFEEVMGGYTSYTGGSFTMGLSFIPY